MTTPSTEDLNEKIGKFKNAFENSMNPLLKQMERVSKELNNISNPKSKKDTKVNGKNVYISLTVDGRVFIQFSCQDEAQMFYDSWREVKESDTKTSWWKKLFSKWL